MSNSGYSPLLDSVGYVLKGCDAEHKRAGGDYYETRKFGGNCDVMLAESSGFWKVGGK